MQYTRLGRSGLDVSKLCLGTMGWGSRNTEAEAHAQLDLARDRGVTFVDTAELYPTYPVTAATTGRTEEIIGTWFARTGRRNEVVLATKVSAATQLSVRGGEGYDGAVIPRTVDQSLARLQTDVIDLYQLHFPMHRPTYHMRRNWTFNPAPVDRALVDAHMIEVLEAMQRVIEAGKVRAFGLSNETVWGASRWIRLAEENGLPRPVSIQNEYSLLCRHADTDMAEFCVAEDIAFLPFSPLAMGILSGKYGPGYVPPNTRRAVEATLNGRITDRVWPAVAAYSDIAEAHGLEPAQMALAWTLSRTFVTSPIFGASGLDQLANNLDAADLELSGEVLDQIAAAHKAHPMPF